MAEICRRCNRERAIYAKGFCHSCYVYFQFVKNREKWNERTKKWRDNHKDYWRNYYYNNKEKIKEANKRYMEKRKNNGAGQNA